MTQAAAAKAPPAINAKPGSPHQSCAIHDAAGNIRLVITGSARTIALNTGAAEQATGVPGYVRPWTHSIVAGAAHPKAAQ